MRTICALLLVFSLLQFSRTGYARSSLRDYWKCIMKDQAIPEAIADLLEDPPISSSEARKGLFYKDFKVKPTLIIYHSHDVLKQESPFVDIYSQDQQSTKLKTEETFLEHFKEG